MHIKKLNEASLWKLASQEYTKYLRKLKGFEIKSRKGYVELISKRDIPLTTDTKLKVVIGIGLFPATFDISIEPFYDGYYGDKKTDEDVIFEYVSDLVNDLNRHFSLGIRKFERAWWTFKCPYYFSSGYIKLKLCSGQDISSIEAHEPDELAAALNRQVTSILEFINNKFTNEYYQKFEIDWSKLKYED